jgi:CRP/FNR family transcriptional regulator, cyclic AMP receptor protein
MSTSIPYEARQRLIEQLAHWELPDQFLMEVIDHSHCIWYAPGASVFIRGSSADLIFCVLTGVVKVCCPNPNGTRVVVQLAGPGDFIGFADVVESNGHHTQTFDAEALTKVSVALFTRDQVLKAVQKLPADKLVSLLEKLNSSWSEVMSSYARFLGMSFKERLETLFSQLASRFGVSDSRGMILAPELSQEELSEMIASSRPMVSRLLADMVSQDLIAREGKRYRILKKSATGATTRLSSLPRFRLHVNNNLDTSAVPQCAKRSGRSGPE